MILKGFGALSRSIPITIAHTLRDLSARYRLRLTSGPPGIPRRILRAPVLSAPPPGTGGSEPYIGIPSVPGNS